MGRGVKTTTIKLICLSVVEVNVSEGRGGTTKLYQTLSLQDRFTSSVTSWGRQSNAIGEGGWL